jgi:putative PIN family toxin of toxin-antitoxin system
MRVVFDTNIFISALAIPGGVAEKTLSRVIEGRDELVISAQIIKEVLTVLSAKFGRNREALSHVAVVLSEIGDLVEPKQTVRVLKDDPDNRILECAHFGRADIIVTGDKEMLRLGEYNRVKIVSLREYLEYRSFP